MSIEITDELLAKLRAISDARSRFEAKRVRFNLRPRRLYVS